MKKVDVLDLRKVEAGEIHFGHTADSFLLSSSLGILTVNFKEDVFGFKFLSEIKLDGSIFGSFYYNPRQFFVDVYKWISNLPLGHHGHH